MGEVQAAPTRQQKFSRGRWHMVKDSDFNTALGQNLSCHQARGACADDRDLMLLHGGAADTCNERHHRLG
jgi:hypothetical protein